MLKHIFAVLALVLEGTLSAQGEFTLTSRSFQEGMGLSEEYSCKGNNLSPELEWVNAPKGTKSFALTVIDINGPQGDVVHWLVYNIPPKVKHIDKGAATKSRLTNGALQGINYLGKLGYTGPCPPKGERHNYVFTLYALDEMVNLGPKSTFPQLQSAMDGHVIGQAALTGYFMIITTKGNK